MSISADGAGMDVRLWVVGPEVPFVGTVLWDRLEGRSPHVV